MENARGVLHLNMKRKKSAVKGSSESRNLLILLGFLVLIYLFTDFGLPLFVFPLVILLFVLSLLNRKEHKDYRRIEAWITRRIRVQKDWKESRLRSELDSLCYNEERNGKNVRGLKAYVEKNAYRRMLKG